MEFNQKLQQLRKQKGLTQEELAEKLYVSRTAISKWEAGRGYPGIDSLKAIASFFSVTLDALLSSEQILSIAQEDQKQVKTHFCDFLFALLDLCMALLLFLPFFGVQTSDGIQTVSLLSLGGISPYLKAAYFAVVIAACATGVLTLALQSCTVSAWVMGKSKLSLTLGVLSVLLFTVGRQPYAAVFVFSLLAMKVCTLLKRH